MACRMANLDIPQAGFIPLEKEIVRVNRFFLLGVVKMRSSLNDKL